MGQSGSVQLETVPSHAPAPIQAQPLPVKKVPPPRPSSPPKRPRSPSRNPKYAVEKNRVLPVGGLPQRRLRRVSQEYSNIHPEFADMFPKQNSEGEDEDEEEEMEVTEEVSPPSEPPLYGGAIDGVEDVAGAKTDSVSNVDVSNGSLSTSNQSSSKEEPMESNLHRTNSLDRVPTRPKGHARRPSRTTSLMNEHHTIFEDPRESLAENRDHLYDNWKKDPYMNPTPNIVSLPVKSNFDIDVSYNMTYAQLAEHRRQKYLEELAKKNGINVAKLQSDLADNSNVVYNPFQRQYSRESTRSTSTTSSDAAGVSFRKKKRAPPPPGAKSDQHEEPPVDYDMDVLSSKPEPAPTKNYALKQQQRRPSAASTASVMSVKSKPAPQPPSVNVPPTVVLNPQKNTVQVPSTPPPPTMFPHPSTKSLPSPTSKTAASPSAELSTSTISPSPVPSLPVLPPGPKKILSDDASDSPNLEREAISKLDKLVSNNTTVSDGESECDSYETVPSSPEKYSEENLCPVKNGTRESNSDIQMKVVKARTPPMNVEKPKDANDMFREQLAQRYNDRLKRREEELKKMEEEEKKKEKIDEDEDEEDMSARSEKKHGESVAILRKLSKDLDKKWLSHRRSRSPEPSSHETDDELATRDSKSSRHHRVFSDDWTPEHDLDSDDDIEDRHVSSHQRSTSEGFKSSIIPTKLKNEIKKSGKGKFNKKHSDSSTDEKQKYESIRKLKKSMHKSVKNAFGSLSRASGKLMLRKQKSMDFESEEALPLPSNWQLSTSMQQLNGVARNLQKWSSEGDVLTSEADDSEHEVDSMDSVPMSIYSEKTQPDLNGNIPRQTHSLQRERTCIERVEDASSRLYKKKKKKAGYIPNGKHMYTEKPPKESLMNEQIKEKERQIEAEKHRHVELEREMLRLQALEREERYRRLQTVHFQQQLQILQQSMGTGATALSTPPLPQPGGLHSYSVPDFRQTHQGYSHIHTPGLPRASMTPGMDMSFNGTNMPNLTSVDLNYLSNLMRMNGVQPPASTQQWAYLLSSINMTAQPPTTKAMFAPPPDLTLQTMYVTTTGPDLSKMFSGQSLDESQVNGGSKQSVMDLLTSGKQSHSYSGLGYSQLDHVQMNTLLHDFEKSSGTSEQTAEKVRQRSNPMYYSSDEDELSSGLSPARTSRNFTASANIQDYRNMGSSQKDVPQTYVSANGEVQMPAYACYATAPHPRRQRSPEADSSSGADR